jgi:hypothetical protein
MSEPGARLNLPGQTHEPKKLRTKKFRIDVLKKFLAKATGDSASAADRGGYQPNPQRIYRISAVPESSAEEEEAAAAS